MVGGTDVFVQRGLVVQVAAGISLASLPADVVVWDAAGRQLTAGIVDMHSHAGVDSLPELRGNDDTNELSSDTTPYVRSKDGLQPLDRQIQVIKSGGVTTSLVLPGSGNNIGGEAYVIKHAVGPGDGRPEISVADMLAAPDGEWRYMKMACGENAKRVYGRVGEHGPTSRLGESWEFRRAFDEAARLVEAQDDWCAAVADAGLAAAPGYLPRDLAWESLAAVLRGHVHVNTHCYTVPDLEAFVDHTNEFKFAVRAFHHAHQTFLVPEILKRTWGGDPPASAREHLSSLFMYLFIYLLFITIFTDWFTHSPPVFSDNMYFKAEAYVGSEYAGKVLWENGLTPVYVSDNPVLNAQHVVFEAAKAYHYGLPYHAALASVTTAPAERLGLGQRLGKVKPGFDADLVVWDSDPLSVGATPVQVWIDGAAQFDHPVELEKPPSPPTAPDASLADVPPPSASLDHVIFTGLARVLLTGREATASDGPGAATALNVVISDGRIACVGPCTDHVRAASADGARLVAFAPIGLREIDAERDTDNGPADVFGRAVDGLALDTKKLRVSHDYAATRAISAPALTGGFTHHGTSVGFLTGAAHALAPAAVFAPDLAVHRTLTLAAKRGPTPSISTAVGALRHALLQAVAAATNANANANATDPFSEEAYLAKVVAGELPLAVTVHSADAIAALLSVKALVDETIAAKAAATSTSSSAEAPPKIRLVIVGGAESHLVARELAAAGVGVLLAPLQSYATTWDQRRALTGAPLTNGTAVDALVDAGVATAIGLEEDWLVRSLALLAGIAYKNGGHRFSEKAALDLISTNVYKILGYEEPDGAALEHFAVFEGSPLEIGSRIKAVGGGWDTPPCSSDNRKLIHKYGNLPGAFLGASPQTPVLASLDGRPSAARNRAKRERGSGRNPQERGVASWTPSLSL